MKRYLIRRCALSLYCPYNDFRPSYCDIIHTMVFCVSYATLTVCAAFDIFCAVYITGCVFSTVRKIFSKTSRWTAAMYRYSLSDREVILKGLGCTNDIYDSNEVVGLRHTGITLFVSTGFVRKIYSEPLNLCSQTWYGGSSSWAWMSYKTTGLLF